ncbi:hypothetical protein HY486_01980 [Candidatus Woesearchaeota archaeon]|nr:hypothetical protein [Candidatus Woesearchaeota archaeon]
MKEQYEILQKKLQLPSFERMDSEFNISKIEPKGNILIEITAEIKDRIENAAGLVQEMVHPNGDTAAALFESSFFTQEDKKELLVLERDLMILCKEYLLAEYTNDEKNTAALLNKTLQKWPEIRKKLLPYIEKLKHGWANTKETKEILEYLG